MMRLAGFHYKFVCVPVTYCFLKSWPLQIIVLSVYKSLRVYLRNVLIRGWRYLL